MTGAAAIQYLLMLSLGLLNEAMRRVLESHANAATADERRRAAWRLAGYAAASSALVGVASAGLMVLLEWFIPFPLISPLLFWSITFGFVVLSLPLTLLESWRWKAATRRFESWESLDLD